MHQKGAGMEPSKPVVLTADETRRRLAIALDRAGQGAGHPVERLAAGDPGAVATLPTWVAQVGFVEAAADRWLYAARVVGESPDASSHGATEGAPAGAAVFAAGQFVLRAPVGRYMLDTLDVGTGRWIARESAAGGPIIAGLFCPGNAIFVRIRRVADPGFGTPVREGEEA
jgi:hypothetical protein